MNEKKVIPFQTTESGFYHRRAIKSIDKEDYISALKNLNKAAEMEPDNLSYKLDLANTYSRMGLYERSNLELGLMLHREDMPPEALFGLGSNFMAMGDYDQAESLLHLYEQQEPEGEYLQQADDALAYMAQCDYDTPLDRELDELSMDGKGALDAGDLERAEECLRKALDKDPSMLYVRNNLALTYFYMGETERAWQELHQVLRQDPMDVYGKCNESMFLLAEGKKKEARAAVKALRPEQIEEVDELFKYCLALADAQLDEELEQALKKMFLTCPYDISMLYLWAACLYNQARYSESVRVFEKLTVLDADGLTAFAYFRLASAAAREGKPPKKRISYGFEWTPDMTREIDETLEKLLNMEDGEIRDELEDEQVRRCLHTALLGEDPRLSQTLALLGYAGGTRAERMLREVLLSPMQNVLVKRTAMEALSVRNAPGPYFTLNEGKLMVMRVKPMEFSGFSNGISESALQVLNDTLTCMEENCPQEDPQKASDFIVTSWMAYLMREGAKKGKQPRVLKPRAWAGALVGLYLESLGKPADWEKLAREGDISLRGLLDHRRKILGAREEMEEIARRNREKDEE